MLAKLCLMTCALAVAQPPDRSEWLCQPRLVRGQELVYSGSFTEEAETPGVHFQRGYRLDLSVFVLDAGPHKTEAAFLTVLTLKTGRPAEREPAAPTSVRLEPVEIDANGRVRGRPGATLAAPVEGPPTVECGAFVEVPATRLGVNHFWEVAEDGRPPRSWRVAGTEAVGGTTCVKLVGQQQSDDWNSPRADRTAWRRRDTVWLAPQLGVAYRVERIIERRDPARETPTHRTVLRYELDSRLTYPGELFAHRRQEIGQAQKFLEEAAPLLRQPAPPRGQLDAVLKHIAYHLESQPPTPYRKAVVHLQHRLEAARRGELPPEPTTPEEPQAARVAAIGRAAPDFVATDLLSRQSTRLQRFLGRPLVLFFYNPHTDPGAEVLRFAKDLSQRRHGAVTVVGMAVTDDANLVRKQHAELKLSFAVLDGNGLHVTYDVRETPRLVVVDAAGIVRGLYTGWGPHSAREIDEELQRWLPKGGSP
jgi:peroxiredoxin